ncbi:DsbA family oxidoreductase [Brevibacillus dissolubilis]|uniref:DsbA family oxidoreductase n=1 Tax=Brevibacillus dissolubilis TaxID=1844116 RepID=UPI001115CECC|nr:DsbA family oxidoreductase [Brevibacillus dissolubilis]
MTVKVQVYSDYVCPFCFIAEVPLEQAIQGKDVEVEWMPYELRSYPAETLRVEDEYLPRVWKDSVYPMAEHYGVNITLPHVSPQPHTHLAFEGYQFAKERGKGNEYNHRMFQAFFQEEQDIGDIDVLTKLAGEIGLDESEYREALVSQKYRDAHKKALERAAEVDITAVPTFIIGDSVLRGVRSKEALEQVIEVESRKVAKAGGSKRG